ncbi:uncharacterized protein SCHCODRAFT_02483659 [Schizophyllum commune H4-8]|uniref:uncharacterized protein n=1 Tax=Schizophyllum commune (strain H4-8 / FGSC 9210) TaxID=578458 RepID=UPI00215E0C43|nr:uncharacterized protein SCHCODRAFT_02483659 [Schizophyllum commune H4-8]KAI5900850.1 hypothetical protein SCHCODRAFT_02483659 [Schizophyllum commune H4-8]
MVLRNHPIGGSYVVVSLDPVASLAWLDDPISFEESCNMQCGKYIAYLTEPWSEDDYVDRVAGYVPCSLVLVAQGRPPTNPSALYNQAAAMPILPNTSSELGRRPVHAYPSLPWDDCCHTSPLSIRSAYCKPRISNEEPESMLVGANEEALLEAYLGMDDIYLWNRLHDREKGREVVFPPDEPRVVRAIEGADKDYKDAERWRRFMLDSKVYEGEERDEDAASEADEEDYHAPSSRTPEAPVLAFPSRNAAQRVMVRYSYDLSSFESPPDPVGFLRELDEMKRIATDCRDRWNQQVVEVEQKNAQFIAALEAQGVRITPRKPSCLRRCFQRVRRLARAAVFWRKRVSPVKEKGRRGGEHIPSGALSPRASSSFSDW